MRYSLPATARYRYLAAILVAFAALIARTPLHPTTAVPFITYVPWVVISALMGGLGPGFLTTILCIFESIYFSIERDSSFAIAKAMDWRLGGFTATCVVISLLAEWAKRDQTKLTEYVNTAAARVSGRPQGGCWASVFGR